MTNLQRTIIKGIVEQFPASLERKMKIRKHTTILTGLQKFNYIGSEESDINILCRAIIFAVENDDADILLQYFHNLPDELFTRGIITANDKAMHDAIIKFLNEHELINITGLEKRLSVPVGTITLALSAGSERKIPAKYFPQLVEELKKYGFYVN